MVSNIVKKKKPEFNRYNSGYLVKLHGNYRKQKGLHNKTRLKKKGHPKSPSIGYGSPKEIKGFYKSEFSYKLIKSEKDLQNLDAKNIILSKNLGLRKKLYIINKIKSLNVKILNIKDIDKFIKDAEDKLKQNKTKKKVEYQKKQDVQKKTEVKAVDKKELTLEEKEEKEKIEKKKLLEKGL